MPYVLHCTLTRGSAVHLFCRLCRSLSDAAFTQSLARQEMDRWTARELQALLQQDDVTLLVSHILGTARHAARSGQVHDATSVRAASSCTDSCQTAGMLAAASLVLAVHFPCAEQLLQWCTLSSNACQTSQPTTSKLSAGGLPDCNGSSISTLPDRAGWDVCGPAVQLCDCSQQHPWPRCRCLWPSCASAACKLRYGR